MKEPTQTQVVRQLMVGHDDRIHPRIRRDILEAFLKCRQDTKDRVVESLQHPLINVTTYTQFDAVGNVLCEDVVVEARHKFLGAHL